MLEEGFGGLSKPDLKEIYLGSEALPYKLVKNFYEYSNNKNINVTNFYGPTECCVESAYFKFDPEHCDEKYDIAPIGRPALNEQIYILDKYLNFCPVGVRGEICIAGKGLARQYLNDSERTGEKFVQFPSMNGLRIYRTGDTGKILSDGNIEYIGRMDDQVKIRGYRVELQEIEKHLRGMEEIADCVVTVFGTNGSSELSAYYTSTEEIDTVKIKQHLGVFLPKYMIPVHFMQLDRIPLAANGKANRKLLPDPATLTKKAKFREPKDEIEKLILKICTEILKADAINLEDNFFEIGGHSLNAVRVISRIQKELDVDLALKEIFYTPVLAEIAEKVRILNNNKDSVKEKIIDDAVIVPISDDELMQLSNLQFEDEE
jgi:acyl carrier protein